MSSGMGIFVRLVMDGVRPSFFGLYVLTPKIGTEAFTRQPDIL